MIILSRDELQVLAVICMVIRYLLLMNCFFIVATAFQEMAPIVALVLRVRSSSVPPP